MKSEAKMAQRIKEISGVDTRKCMKCGRCSASCPAYNEMDIRPHQFVSYVQNGNIEPLMNSKSIWKCLSCFACVERCPRDVKPAKVIEAVRLVPSSASGVKTSCLRTRSLRFWMKRRRSSCWQAHIANTESKERKKVQRIGVFVCHCGTNIAGTVDVKRVVEAVRKEPGVVYAEDYQYMCSEAGQQKIADAVKSEHLTGIVICSCSPRMHEGTFRKAAEKAGLNPYLVEIANIREQCSWIHKDVEEGTEKAVILARAAIAKVMLNAPLQPGESRVVKRALVIGGGIAGIQTALDIADAGYEVDIVEKTPSIGGRMSQLDKTFPTLDCSSCILTPKMGEVNAHEKINIFTYSEVEKVSGFVGDFSVDIRKKRDMWIWTNVPAAVCARKSVRPKDSK